jgi:hypothetical protein
LRLPKKWALEAFDVQRQTMTGKGHVVELIRAVYGQP